MSDEDWLNFDLEAMQKETMHPDLVEYTDMTAVGRMLRHPLVYSLYPISGMVNRMYEAKKTQLLEAEAEEDWYTYVFLHERPWRIDAFKKIKKHLEPAGYWALLGAIWTDTENMGANLPLWKRLLTDDIDNREDIMDESEQASLTNLPDPLMIYRGHQGINRDGFSWSLEKERAEWFANRFAEFRDSGRAQVRTLTVPKSDVIAYLSRRGEEEIIYIPTPRKTRTVDEYV